MIFGQNDVWKPNLFLGNAFDDMSAIGEDFITVRYYNNGTAIWTPLDMIITSCSVDVTHFPFDQQTCAIHFISVGTLPEEIVMNSEIDHAIITRYIEHEIWQLNETTAFASIVGITRSHYREITKGNLSISWRCTLCEAPTQDDQSIPQTDLADQSVHLDQTDSDQHPDDTEVFQEQSFNISASFEVPTVQLEV
ncbi:unnamed protein product [Mytilus edulis]|uniref:Neurotransmitter-gated ion-channel ligand-binding domain-containing protein n=1 Tax=Mytilus edulis TaxID=6550 RepID=A0A8S3RL29_MYTED|nr:unnamed protein product [Mytilus edulis]